MPAPPVILPYLTLTFPIPIAHPTSPYHPQFGKRAILDYPTHQRRLFVGLATAYAMHVAMLQLKQVVVKVGERATG